MPTEATHLEALLDLDKAARLRMAGPLEHAIVHAKAVGLGEEHLEYWANLLQVKKQKCAARTNLQRAICMRGVSIGVLQDAIDEAMDADLYNDANAPRARSVIDRERQTT